MFNGKLRLLAIIGTNVTHGCPKNRRPAIQVAIPFLVGDDSESAVILARDVGRWTSDLLVLVLSNLLPISFALHSFPLPVCMTGRFSDCSLQTCSSGHLAKVNFARILTVHSNGSERPCLAKNFNLILVKHCKISTYIILPNFSVVFAFWGVL